MCEWLLDAELRDELVLRFAEDGKLRELRAPVEVKLYSDYDLSLERLADELNAELELEEWFEPPHYVDKREVAVIKVEPALLRKAELAVRRIGLRIWNAFPHPLQRVLWERGLRPCVCDSGELASPSWVILRFRGWAGRPNLASWEHVEFIELEIDGRIIKANRSNLGSILNSFEPQVVVLEGREWRKLLLSDPEVRVAISRAVLMDSIPLDLSLRGLMEWSYLSYAPLKLVAAYSIGKVLTSLEAFNAMRRKYLIPEVCVRLERPKSPSSLLRADRGGLILTPKPGIYWKAAQLDFESFFPSIISRENVSPETVNAPECERWVEAPEVGHRICLDRRGIVPETVESLIELRRLYKGLGDEERAKAIKWILVACFGYLGYRNSRFGSIESYESVTAFARWIGAKAVEIASRRGKVLHFLVDSIFVETDEPEVIAREVEDELGYRMKVEADYIWLVFLPSRNSSGVPSRYFGLLRDGSIKAKGLLRRDMSPLASEFVEKALSLLKGADSEGKLAESLLRVRELFDEVRGELLRGAVPSEMLVIERRLSPSCGRRLAHREAASILGIGGGSIRFLLAKAPYPVEMGYSGCDRERYFAELLRAVEPFEFMLKQMERIAPGSPQFLRNE